ncbi:MAG: exodeoxyribonuclease VII small subunit [Bacteroidales bacterium]|nr:exodeoxyribonuclease VII small subunit [Bacteroidales bacterium]RLD37048.1 MAG: exodeoxyribonuclease VII small subunit [Bacteroidota bacterium]
MSKKLTYSIALEELENIIQEIENEEISIDDLSIKVKRASTLLKFCKEKLRSTEDDINTILGEIE